MTRTSATSGPTGDPLEGQVIDDRYTIKTLIGRGGMGLVYLASDPNSARDVVVKMLSSHWVGDANAVARFDREGKRLSDLAHPNIVAMYGFGRHRDRAYIVMEYLEGEHLRHYLGRKGKLRLADFVPIASQILAGVGYAHARGIMLRDIKPANIMLCENDGKANFVKILDFGLAKMVEGDDVEVTKSHLVGTAGYLAPEQIKGEPCDVRVDVYALGILFFQMLGGQSPILGDNDGAILYNHVHGEPRRLEEVLPSGHDIPKGLIGLIRRCIEKDPERRPMDANEVAEGLFECVPTRFFALPTADAASRAGIEAYQAHTMRRASGTAGDEADEATNRWNKAELAKETQSPGSTKLGMPVVQSRGPSRPPPPRPAPTKPKTPPSSSRQLEVIEGGGDGVSRTPSLDRSPEARRSAERRTAIGVGPRTLPKPPPRKPQPASPPVSPPLSGAERKTEIPAEPLRGLADVLEPADTMEGSAVTPADPALQEPRSTGPQVPITVELDSMDDGEVPARGRGVGLWAAVAGVVVLLGGGGLFLATQGAEGQPAASGAATESTRAPSATQAAADASPAAGEPAAETAEPGSDVIQVVVESPTDEPETDKSAGALPPSTSPSPRPQTKETRTTPEPTKTAAAKPASPDPADASPKAPSKPQPSATPTPFGDEPASSGSPSKGKAPPPPPPAPEKKKDDVFIDPGKKDNGIFLPVGKK